MKIVSPLWQYFKDTKKLKPVGCIEGEFSKSITLPVSSTSIGQQLYFDPDSELDNAVIKTIELDINTNLVRMFYQNTQLDPIGQAQSTRAMLTLSNAERNVMVQMPLSTLIRSSLSGKPSFFLLDNINWHNCYIEILDNSGYSTSNGFFLRVTYDRKK